MMERLKARYKILLIIIATILSVIANSVDYSMISTMKNHTNVFTTSNNYFLFVYVIALIYIYHKVFSKKINALYMILGGLFGVINLISLSIHHYDSFKFLIYNKYQICLSVCCILGFMVMFYLVAVGIEQVYKRNIFMKEICSNFTTFYIKHIFIYSFIIILALWSIWIIAFYPGSANFDYIKQLSMYDGYIEISNHHPVLSTYIIGTCMSIGRTLINDSFGVFIYIFLQTIVMAYAFARIIEFTCQIKCNIRMIYMMLFFYGIVPLWAANCQFGDKDILYCGVLILFTLDIAKIIKNPLNKAFGIKNSIKLIVLGILVCLLRNNGLYIVLPTLLILAIFSSDKKRILFCSTAAVFILYEATQIVVIPALGVKDGSIAEAMSVPFQQTARYIRYNGKEVTVDEHNSINGILDYDSIRTAYCPQISDPVKQTCKYDNISGGNREYWNDYFQTWMKMFFKHPGTYLQATIANTYGYYSFTPNIKSSYAACSEKFYSYISDGPSYASNKYDIQSIDVFSELRNLLRKISESFEKIPLLGMTYKCATYTWALIFLIFYEKKRKDYYNIIIMIPSIMTIMVAFASPVNDCFRYFIYVAAALPLSYALSCCRINIDNRHLNKGDKYGQGSSNNTML